MRIYSSLLGLVAAVSVVQSPVAAPSRPGSACADTAVTASCVSFTVTVNATVTNCGTRNDTFLVTGKVLEPDGSVLAEETLQIPLGPGKSFSYDFVDTVMNSTTPGDYQLTLIADAEKGTGYDNTTVYLYLPCP